MTTIKVKYAIAIILVIFTGVASASNKLSAEDIGPIIEVEVKGMFCPICAYKAEKKLKAVEGVESVQVDLKAGTATIVTTQMHTHKITEEELREAIKNAGLDSGEIKYIESEEH